MVRVHLLLPNLVRKNEVFYFTNEPPTPVLLERWGCGEDAIALCLLQYVASAQLLGVVATLLARVHLLLPNLVRKNEVFYFTNEPPTPVLLERWGCGEDAISPTTRLVEFESSRTECFVLANFCPPKSDLQGRVAPQPLFQPT